MKIAVCDDSREDRGALRVLLEACGHDFEIREYGSGTELYADMGYVRECGIVFLDINMEGMDGLEAAGKIKTECPKIHIVLVTAYVNYALDGRTESLAEKKFALAGGGTLTCPILTSGGYGADIYCQGTKVLTYLGSGYGWACERTPAERGIIKAAFGRGII